MSAELQTSPPSGYTPGIGGFNFLTAVVVAGAIGLVLHIALALIGLALGLAATGPTQGQPLSAGDVPAAAGVWWVLSSLASLAVAGLIVGVMTASRDWTSALISGGTVWAVAALLAMGIAASAVGQSLGGMWSVFFSGRQVPEQRIEIVLRDIDTDRIVRVGSPDGKPARTGAGEAQPTGQGRSASQTLSDQVEKLSWVAVLEIARQLEDPQVREMLRRYAIEIWEETEGVREDIRAVVGGWIAQGAEVGSETYAALTGFLSRLLLIDEDVLRETLEGWASQAGKTAEQVERVASDVAEDVSQSSSGTASDGPATDSSTGGAAEPADNPGELLSRRIEAAIAKLQKALGEVMDSSGILKEEQRERILSEIRDALQTTEERAEQVLSRWESTAQDVGREVARASQTIGDQVAERAEGGLDILAAAAGWIALALLAGWAAAAGGAYAGGRLSARAKA